MDVSCVSLGMQEIVTVHVEGCISAVLKGFMVPTRQLSIVRIKGPHDSSTVQSIPAGLHRNLRQNPLREL